MRRLIAALLISMVMAGNPLFASDRAKEQRWANQIVDTLLVGEAVWLEVNGDRILALAAEAATDTTRGGVILVHGIGAHPAWPEVIQPLRITLPEHGWMTLSVQMPILENQAESADYAPLFDEVAPRFEAAIAYLREQGIENIVIVAHSMGAAMSSHYLASHSGHPVRGFVGIGMNQSKIPRMDNASNLQKINIPVLDLYGSRDLDGVLDSVNKRAEGASKAGNSDYRQLKVDGADHFFNGKEENLIKQVGGWLDRHARWKK